MTKRGLWLSLAFPVAGVLYVLWPGLWRGETPLLRDLFTFFHPWTDYLVRRVSAGEFPAWNPLEYCGLSWAGHIASRLHDPSFALYLVAPYRLAVLLDLAVHVSLGALFASLFLRRLGVGLAGTVLGGCTFALNAWVIAKFEAPGKVAICSFYPLALLAASWASEGRARCAILGMATAIGMQVLSGYPPIAAYFIPAEILAGAIITLGTSTPGPRNVFAKLLPLAVGAALGIMLSAVALVPFLDEARRAAYWRPLPFEAASARSLHPIYLAGLLLPRIAGMPGADRYWGGELADFGAGALYMSLPAFGCAVAAVVLAFRGLPPPPRDTDSQRAHRERIAATWALTLCAVLALIVAAGRYAPFFALLRELPFYSRTRWPSQSLALVTTSLALLAGIGLDGLALGTRNPRRRWTAPIALLTIGILLLLWSVQSTPGRALRDAIASLAAPHQVEAMRSLALPYFVGDLKRAGALALFAAVVLALPVRFWFVLPLAVGVDLALFGRGLVPFAPRDLFAERTHLGALESLRGSENRILRLPGGRDLGILLSGARDARVFREGRRALSGATHLLDDIPAADGANPLQTARNAYLVGALGRSRTPEDVRARLGAILGVSALVEPSPLGLKPPSAEEPLPDTVSFRTSAFAAVPFARVVDRVTVLRQDNAQIQRMLETGYDPAQEAVVPEAIAGFTLAATGAPAADCTVTRPRAERIGVRVALEREALLVVRESYDPGWRALVDGEERTIVRADYLFMGIPLHPGERDVLLLFQPRSIWVGRGLTAATVLALLAIALGRARGRAAALRDSG
jgi:hypothetical protein